MFIEKCWFVTHQSLGCTSNAMTWNIFVGSVWRADTNGVSISMIESKHLDGTVLLKAPCRGWRYMVSPKGITHDIIPSKGVPSLSLLRLGSGRRCRYCCCCCCEGLRPRCHGLCSSRLRGVRKRASRQLLLPRHRPTPVIIRIVIL